MSLPRRLPIRILKYLVSVIAGLGAAGRAHSGELASGDVLVMQQMIVEATRIDEHPGFFARHDDWLYVAVPDCEILSRCDVEQTLAVARHVGDCLQLNMGFVPDKYRAPLAVPMSFIMFNREPTKTLEAVIPESSDWGPSIANFGGYFPPTHSFEGGVNTGDADTHCTVQNRAGKRWMWGGGGSRGPIPRGTIFLLSRCAPSLPLWYQYGFDGGSCCLQRMIGLNGGLIIAKALWISEEETEKILAEARRTRTLPKLPPIEELFSNWGGADGGNSATRLTPAWLAEAALFLRWGLFGESESQIHRRAFSTFVERSRVEPVTEGLFRECFGFGFAEMQTRLSSYLIDAANEPICVDYQTIRHYPGYRDSDHPPFPTLDTREATPAEIARLLGDWERMQGNDLRSSNPALSQVYLNQAGKTLHKCYAKGERDPRFVAVLGLYDYDVGDIAEARSMLVAAVKSNVLRPAAYIDLAQINLDEAKSHPGAANGKLSAQQVAAVLKPLFAVRKKTRLDAKGYLLIAEAWSNSAERPVLANLEALNEGIRLYPFDSALILSSATTFAHCGYETEAMSLIENKLRFADIATAKQLEHLKTSLNIAR